MTAPHSAVRRHPCKDPGSVALDSTIKGAISGAVEALRRYVWKFEHISHKSVAGYIKHLIKSAKRLCTDCKYSKFMR